MKEFYYLNQKIMIDDNLLYYINRAGRSTVDSSFNIKRNKLYPYNVIHYVSKGSGTIIYKKKEYTVKKGQLFILNAYEEHQYMTDADDLLVLNWIEFAGGDSVKIVNSILNDQLIIIDEPYSDKVNRYMLRIFALINNNLEQNNILISKLLYSILLNLLRLNISNKHKEISEGRLINIKRTMEYIENHLHEDLNIEQLSKISNYSAAYFARLFHKVTGVTPAQYILNRRINEAKKILSNSDESIYVISDKLGFCSASHFIKNFKKAEGLTPAEYRKQSLLFKKEIPKL